nr:GNAT family N-acetyltransferase [Candidatus Njordarchaeota archaeon]
MSWFSIRRFTLDDIEFAFQITSKENWGYSKKDFASMLDEGLGSHFVAEESEGRRGIGMISTYDYGGKLGWIGNVVVLEEFRQRGVASALVKHGVKNLRTDGIKTIRLYSYLQAELLYRRLGFIREGVLGVFSARFGGRRSQAGSKVSSSKSNLMTVDQVNLERLFHLDETCFGADRKKMLKSVIQDKNATSFVEAQGTSRDKILGYVIASKGETDCNIGPMVCDPKREDIAEELIEATMDHFNAEKFSMVTALENVTSTKILRKLGYEKTIEVLRMRKGRNLYNGRPKWIFAVGGLERG